MSNLRSRLTRLEQHHGARPAGDIDPAKIIRAGSTLERCRRQGLTVAEALHRGLIDAADLGGFDLEMLAAVEANLAAEQLARSRRVHS